MWRKEQENKPKKPYFAKYLPVEGEIKEGDLGWSVNNALYTHYNHLGKDYGQPVKLFLISTDIQVDDEVICPATGNKYTVGEGGYKKNKVTLPYAQGTKHFRVIGEISPEATWVKEGDEFDESKVCKWEGVINAPDGQILPTFYTIKGPCGHFH
jgi:hypothetical protein